MSLFELRELLSLFSQLVLQLKNMDLQNVTVITVNRYATNEIIYTRPRIWHRAQQTATKRQFRTYNPVLYTISHCNTDTTPPDKSYCHVADNIKPPNTCEFISAFLVCVSERLEKSIKSTKIKHCNVVARYNACHRLAPQRVSSLVTSHMHSLQAVHLPTRFLNHLLSEVRRRHHLCCGRLHSLSWALQRYTDKNRKFIQELKRNMTTTTLIFSLYVFSWRVCHNVTGTFCYWTPLDWLRY